MVSKEKDVELSVVASDSPSPASASLGSSGTHGKHNLGVDLGNADDVTPKKSCSADGVLWSVIDWLKTEKQQILSGVTVGLAMVPEAVAFALVAGVDPLVGLQAAWIMGVITSVFGGRPGMISGATGAVAVVMVDLVAKEGVEYLFYAIMLAGVIQVAFGLVGGGKLIRMIPHSVMVGFCNGLAIVIGLAQFNSFKVVSKESSSDDDHSRRLSGGVFAPFTDGSAWVDGTMGGIMAVHVLLAMAVTYLLPKVTRFPTLAKFPSSLAAILACTFTEWVIVRELCNSKSQTIEDIASVNGNFVETFTPVFFADKVSGYWGLQITLSCETSRSEV